MGSIGEVNVDVKANTDKVVEQLTSLAKKIGKAVQAGVEAFADALDEKSEEKPSEPSA